MKSTLLLFFTLNVATMSVIHYEDMVERIAKYLSMTRDEVRVCFNKTSITIEDLMHFDEMLIDDLQSTNFDDSALKMGCLITCLGHKKELMMGAHINIDKIKEILRSKTKGRNQDKLAEVIQILDMCADRVASKTNECEVSLRFLFCALSEAQKHFGPK